jgi:hypothetical protein
VLVDGSSERTIDGLMHDDVGFGKLVRRRDLEPSIPAATFGQGLRDHFARTGLTIEDVALDALLQFGDGRPYPTMTAARYSAFTARREGADTVDGFCVEHGIQEARRHLEDDDAT